MVASKPNKTTYYIGDSFDSSGLRVEAQYSDGTTEDVTSSCDIDTDSFDSRYAGSCSVRISYSDGRNCTTSLALTIKAPSISLNKGSITVSDKGSERITATTTPSCTPPAQLAALSSPGSTISCAPAPMSPPCRKTPHSKTPSSP